MSNGSVSNRLNIVFLSEGYTTNESEKFLIDASNVLTGILSYEPFREYQSYCNAFAISVPSTESGSDHPSYGQFRNTYFNSSYDSSRNYMITVPPHSQDSEYSHGRGKVDSLLKSYMPQCGLPVLVVNDPVPGGSGGPLSITAMGVNMPELVTHECGHTLGGLGDEYGAVADAQDYFNRFDAEEPNTTRETRREYIKWKHWITPTTPVPTPATETYSDVVGVFQGAHYHNTGWYRPKRDCMMNSMKVPFCEVCSEVLVRAIYRKARPINSFSPGVTNLLITNLATVPFQVLPQEPLTHSLTVQWFLNGRTVENATNFIWEFPTGDLSNGTYTVKAVVRDRTPAVRKDPAQLLSQTVSWSVKVNVRIPVSIQIMGRGTVYPTNTQQGLGFGLKHTLTARPGSGCTFQGWSGDITSASTNISFILRDSLSLTATFDDISKPTVSILSPKTDVQVTNGTVTVSGRATDNVAVQSVVWRVGGGSYVEALGASNWTASFIAQPGTNSFEAVGIDTSGNRSRPALRNIFYSVRSPFSLLTDGNGSVTPQLNGSMLEIGRAYQITATPKTGNLFAGWSIGTNSRNPTLNFLMQSNLALQANFVPNPFGGLKGTYSGLFYRSNDIQHASSGFLRFTVDDRGVFSGSLLIAGKTHSVSGRFWVDGSATVTVPRFENTSLIANLQLDMLGGSDRVSGTISDGNWTSDFNGDRAVFNGTSSKPLQAGRYTLALLNTSGCPDTPSGDGCAEAVIDATGTVKTTGVLADGTPIVSTAKLSKNAYWPMYLKLYNGQGSLLAWAGLTNRPETSIAGEVNWIKPTLQGVPYPLGFTNRLSLVGSTYRPAQTCPVPPSLTNAQVVLSGGTLVEPITNSAQVTTNGRISVTGTNKVRLSMTLSNGWITGSFENPVTGSNTSARAILLPQLEQARGFFLQGTNRTGAFLLEPIREIPQ